MREAWPKERKGAEQWRTSVAEPVHILIVSQPSVAAPMAEVAAHLRAPGMVVYWVDAAAFNADATPDPHATILLVSNAARCSRERLGRFPRLAAIVFIASGTESADVAAATERGVVVAHGHSEENADSMAEATVLLMLAVLYDLHRAERILRNGEAKPEAFSRMVQGKTVGLVGFGKIARGVVGRLQGWGARFLASKRTPPATAPDGVEFVDLDTLMARSDVVSLHAALNGQSRHMIGEAQIRLLRPGGVLINTGRGGLIDEAALVRCAAEQELWLGLDTFEQEPLPADSPLRALPRTILTPHLVGHTVEGKDSLVRAAVANIGLIARGEPPLHSRNWDGVARVRAAATQGGRDVLRAG